LTRVARKDGKLAGKRITLRRDGGIIKHHPNELGEYVASNLSFEGEPTAALNALLSATLETLGPHEALILGTAAEPSTLPTYSITTIGNIEERELDAGRMHVIDGRVTVARSKQTFLPSRLLLIDFDVDEQMPEWMRTLTPDERWARLCEALPELQGVARLSVPSSTGRALLPNGDALRAPGRHEYIVLAAAPESSAALDTLRKSIEIRLWAAGLGYIKLSEPNKDTGTRSKLKRGLIDTSVLSQERLVFAGAPEVTGGLKLAPTTGAVVHPGQAVTFRDCTEAEIAAYERLTGATVRVKRNGGGNGNGGGASMRISGIEIHDTESLLSATRITTKQGEMSAAEIVLLDDKERCQVPAELRVSSSWAAFVRYTEQTAFLFDVGEGKKYILFDARFVSGKLDEALRALAGKPKTALQHAARSVLVRHAWRCPVQLGYLDLCKQIADAHPDIDIDDLVTLARALRTRAERDALASTRMQPNAFPANALFQRLESIDGLADAVIAKGGIHIIKAPHDTGKTQRLLRPVALNADRVAALSPLVSLVDDSAERLELDHYHQHNDAPALALCINSLANPLYKSATEAPDVLLIDEVSACLRALHSPSGTMKQDKAAAVLSELKRLINSTQTLVFVDADINTRDVQLLAALTEREVNVYQIDERKRNLTAYFTTDKAALAALSEAVAAGEPVWFHSDSAKLIAAQTERLKTLHPELTVEGVHKMPGLETTGIESVQLLLKNIDEQAPKVDVLLTSPVVQSGVSLNVEHFTKHICVFNGTLTAPEFNQMMRRDRTATEVLVGIAGAGRNSYPDTYAAVLNEAKATARQQVETHGGAVTFKAATAWDETVFQMQAERNAQLNHYARNLWFLLESRGWTCKRVERDRDTEGLGRDIKIEAATLIDAKRETAILGADELSGAERAELQEKRAPTPEESAALARASVRWATGKRDIDEAITVEDVELWQGGKLDGQAQLFDDVTGRGTSPSLRDINEAEDDVPIAARSFDAARRAAIRALFAEVGLDPVSGSGEVTADSVSAAFRRLSETPHANVLGHFKIARFDARPAYPVRWLNSAVGKCGLWLDEVAKPDDGRVYCLGSAAKRSRAGKLQAPGLALMRQISAQRAGVAEFLDEDEDEPLRHVPAHRSIDS
jgi:hypothetical protein